LFIYLFLLFPSFHFHSLFFLSYLSFLLLFIYLFFLQAPKEALSPRPLVPASSAAQQRAQQQLQLQQEKDKQERQERAEKEKEREREAGRQSLLGQQKQQNELKQQQLQQQSEQNNHSNQNGNNKREEKQVNMQDLRDDIVRHHRQQIDDIMETIKKEMELLRSVDSPTTNFDNYAASLDNLLQAKIRSINSLRSHFVTYQKEKAKSKK